MQTWSNPVLVGAVRLEPENPATCHWSSDTRLSCAVARPLAEATRFRVRLAKGLRTQSGSELGSRTLSFDSARPSVGPTSHAGRMHSRSLSCRPASR
jgi:hypothetical protein